MYQDSETREYTKPDLNAQFREEEVKWDGKWRNVYFSKSGSTLYAPAAHNSIAEASTAVANTLAKRPQTSGLTDVEGRPVIMPWSDYSHTIQIPVKE